MADPKNSTEKEEAKALKKSSKLGEFIQSNMDKLYQAIHYSDPTNKKDLDKPVPLALKLTDDIEKKLGLDEEYDYYIAFAYSFSASGDANYRKYVEYLFGKC